MSTRVLVSSDPTSCSHFSFKLPQPDTDSRYPPFSTAIKSAFSIHNPKDFCFPNPGRLNKAASHLGNASDLEFRFTHEVFIPDSQGNRPLTSLLNAIQTTKYYISNSGVFDLLDALALPEEKVLKSPSQLVVFDESLNDALTSCAKWGLTSAMAILLNAGANPNARTDDPSKRPALQMASYSSERSKVLLSANADPNAADACCGMTALHAAILTSISGVEHCFKSERPHLISRRLQLVEQLLDAGANINAPLNEKPDRHKHTEKRLDDNDEIFDWNLFPRELLGEYPGGSTPLHLAVFDQNSRAVDFLLNRGARTDLKASGQTPFEMLESIKEDERTEDYIGIRELLKPLKKTPPKARFWERSFWKKS